MQDQKVFLEAAKKFGVFDPREEVRRRTGSDSLHIRFRYKFGGNYR